MAAAKISCSGALLAGALLLVFISPVPETSASYMPVAGLSPERDLKHQNMTGICKSKDIRNNLRSFDSLRGCRVVEGFVQILLFDNVNETGFDDISFPELTEITGYLLLYRVSGLKSVGQLFPNLTVIRGQEKIYEYSFVVYEMSSLQEIGLHSLTDISQGLIRIDKNPSLCYVNSIDWNLIAGEKGDHFIKNIKPEKECPLCPGDDDSTDSPCPISTNKLQMGRHLCWNRQHCQKVCPPECKNSTCDSNGKCCSEMCLGGCTVGNSNSCRVCRKFAIWENGKCMESCPYDKYEYLERRCISKDECIKAKKPLMLHSTIQNEHPYKIHNRSCVLKCPSDHMDDYVRHMCIPCLGRCKKECQGMVIDSLYSAQQLRGCTHINGSLEIQIRGSNKANELEENLNMIEEIDGYLKIVRSFPLVSLNFFKKLKVIRGNTLESQKHVFIVLDNQNLQDIWDWDNRTLKIGRGRLFFHFNPRLCMNKIRMLQQKANLTAFTNLEVAPNSNGDKIACDVKDLVVNVTTKQSTVVVLRWQQFKMKDYRKLLGYVVYSKEALHKNVTLYDGRDACGGDGWRVDDVPITDEQNPTHLLSKLKAYTQYAFYVKTYTIASEDSGAQSRIYYVRTLPDTPSTPKALKVKLPNISWEPPQNPNGNVTYYIVTGELRPEIPEQNNRNYCKPLTNPIIREITTVDETKTISTSTNNICECNDISKPVISKLKNASDVEDQNNFQDLLYNYVYLKRESNSPPDSNRRKRDTLFPNQTKDQHINDSKNNTDSFGRYTSFNVKVYGKTELVFSNLKHYSDYEIKVQACREQEGEEDKNPYCSQTTLVTAKTGRKVGADMVSTISFNQSLGMITIAWDEPPDPNAYISFYEIEYKILDIPHSITNRECITAVDYLNKSKRYTFNNLNPGNYSLRIIANSPAGHEESDYIYFYIDEPSSAPTTVIFLVVLTFLLTLGGVGYYFWKKKFGLPDMKLIPTVNPDYYNNKDYVPDDWEVPRDNIKLIKELGQGSFGMVYEGVAKDIIKGKSTIRCAIKTVNEHATDRERIEFLNEASVMKAFDTAHVVRLMGVVSQGQPTLVVMELMTNGDLKTYLRSHRPDHTCDKTKGKPQPPTLKKILQMAIEISDGMAYLSAKKFVHRDLAARNCMVAEDLTVKIGDFGMTRDIYETDYYRKGTKGLLPVRWMAPESLKDGVFTSNSDVWSYGVVLWEMSTLASQPYQGLSNDQVLRYVIGGGIMERPENCPDKLYDLMMCCWRHKPSDRPSFLQLCALLLEDASPSFSEVSFYHSAAGMEARNSKPSQSPSQDDPSTPLRRNEIDENFSLTSSDSEHEIEAESNFTTYPSMTQNISSTANGYVTTRATNGTTTT